MREGPAEGEIISNGSSLPLERTVGSKKTWKNITPTTSRGQDPMTKRRLKNGRKFSYCDCKKEGGTEVLDLS